MRYLMLFEKFNQEEKELEYYFGEKTEEVKQKTKKLADKLVALIGKDNLKHNIESFFGKDVQLLSKKDIENKLKQSSSLNEELAIGATIYRAVRRFANFMKDIFTLKGADRRRRFGVRQRDSYLAIATAVTSYTSYLFLVMTDRDPGKAVAKELLRTFGIMCNLLYLLFQYLYSKERTRIHPRPARNNARREGYFPEDGDHHRRVHPRLRGLREWEEGPLNPRGERGELEDDPAGNQGIQDNQGSVTQNKKDDSPSGTRRGIKIPS